ncbi:cell wall hydrolase [Neorhizobium sp. DT-125]|uniref:cell wall hydrolase n=1 Tax=Neorhizobium sp. DT-125 TaxID=3396163 RepID=UPI003F1C3E3D
MTAIDKAPLRKAACVVAVALLAGCTSSQTTSSITKDDVKANVAPIADMPRKQVYSYTPADRECLKRAMYFESKRSSKDGFMAVGSVVMNRLTSGAYPDTICGVVSQEKQFAPGLMTRKMNEETAPELNGAADAILRGERNPEVKEAMFFHQAGLKFPYDNMHYVTVAGGNAFYEKRDEDGELQTPAPKPADEYILAFAPHLASPGLMAVNDMSAPATAAVTQADEEEELVLPLEAPVPAQRPRPAAISTAQLVMAPPEVWSLRTGK